MRQYNNEDVGVPLGKSILYYAPPGYGKTYAFQTLPGPIAVIVNEPRDPRIVLKDAKEQIDFFEPDSFDEEIDLLNGWIEQGKEGKLIYKSVCKDGMTFVQGQYRMNLEDDRYGYRLEKEEARNGLLDRFRIDKQDWQPLSSMMQRETYLLNKLSKFGIIVVATALVQENPKWDSSLQAAPALQGQFSQLVSGYFDFIGFVTESWYQDGDGKIHPPRVSFHSEDRSYIAKTCSNNLVPPPGKKSMELDFSKILKLIRG